MSESTTAAIPAEFTDAQLAELRKDDLSAGKFIGRTLVLMFLYSATVMGGVIWWTRGTISERVETTGNASVTEEAGNQ